MPGQFGSFSLKLQSLSECRVLPGEDEERENEGDRTRVSHSRVGNIDWFSGRSDREDEQDEKGECGVNAKEGPAFDGIQKECGGIGGAGGDVFSSEKKSIQSDQDNVYV